MESNLLEVQLRWSDFDPNLHLRHSVYYDWGAMSRLRFLERNGITMKFMQEHSFGPIIFREEARFLKEIRMNEQVTIDIKLVKGRKDFSRWTIQHEIRKNGIVAALITVDGAWLDIKERKLFVPPREVKDAFEKIDHGESFESMD